MWISAWKYEVVCMLQNGIMNSKGVLKLEECDPE
jgi:hypothetical protein